MRTPLCPPPAEAAVPAIPESGNGPNHRAPRGEYVGPEGRLALAARLWGWEPHPGQREFLTLRLADGSEPQTLIAACGRRWGKTEALGCDIATRILTEPDLGQMGVAPTRDQAECLFDSVEEKLRELTEGAETPEAVERLLEEFPHLATFEFRRTPYPQIRRKDTGQMVFWVRSAGRKGRNLRGRGTTRKLAKFRVIVDERAFVDDEAVERAIKPMLATSPGGGQLVEISSPFGRRGGFYEDFLRGERQYRRYRSVRLPSSQNPLVDAGYLDEQRETMTDAAFRTEFLAEFLDTAGAVFAEDDLAAAVCDDDYGGQPLFGCRYVAGIDFARRGDWTVCCVLEVGANALRLVEMVRLQGLGYGAQVEKLTDVLARWGIGTVAADRTGVGDALCESLALAIAARRLRCALEEFVFTQSSKVALIDGLVIALTRKKVRYPPHPTLLSELRNFEAIPTGSGRERLEAVSGHDDCVCALALAVHAAAPLFARAGANRLLGRGGRRATAGKGEEDEWEFQTARQAASSAAFPPWDVRFGPVFPAAAGRLASLRGSVWRLLTSVYRFAPARSAGARAQRWWSVFRAGSMR
jgi:hypothetical protein